MSNFKERLVTGLNNLKIEVAPDGVDKLEIYFSELKKWSKKVNLIAKSSTDEQIIENHFLDSLTLVPLLIGGNKHLLDIGTGAGFPGLVCRAVCAELAVTLVEPRLKRVSFLKHIVRSLELDNVEIIADRIEEDSHFDFEAEITHITARAVTDIGGLLQMVERFGTGGVQLLCMKGPKWKQELEEAKAIIDQSTYELADRKRCYLPFSGAERSLLIFTSKQMG